MKSVTFKAGKEGVVASLGDKHINIVMWRRLVPKSKTMVQYRLEFEGRQYMWLLLEEAKDLASVLLRGEAQSPRKLPVPAVNVMSWNGNRAQQGCGWLLDDVTMFQTSAARPGDVAAKLLKKMESAREYSPELCSAPPDKPRSVEKIISLAADEGAKATLPARVDGVWYSSTGSVAKVVSGDTVVLVDAHRLSLLGHTVSGKLYVSEPYAPVAFKQGDRTVALIMSKQGEI